MESEGGSEQQNPNSLNTFKKPCGCIVIKKNKHKKKKKNKNKKKNKALGVKKPNFKKKNRSNMNSLTENFTNAATWQYKHQIAYWKAKAKALEYENRVLHDLIRKNHIPGSSTSTSVTSDATASEESTSESDEDYEHINGHIENEEPDLEVSEAFIEFLAANAKYKEDARLERERLRTENKEETEDERIKRMEAPPSQNPEDEAKQLEELYGSNWMRISALETSLKSRFMSECDKGQPIYWPNIPFNFNFS